MSFEINLKLSDLVILYRIQQFFGCGSVTSRPDKNIAVYRVTRLSDLTNKVVPHFVAYPLLTTKYRHFMIWQTIVSLVSQKAHLDESGLNIIFSYYCNLNGVKPMAIQSKYTNLGIISNQ